MLNGIYIGIDLETTGVDYKKDKIIEIGLIKLRDHEIIDEYSVLVNPGVKLPLKVKNLTGINDGMLSNAPNINEVLPDVIEFIGEYPIISHNIGFDKSFLEEAILSYDMKSAGLLNETYDTFELARIIIPDAVDYKLSTLCKAFDIKTDVSHRALSDAKASIYLALALIKEIEKIELLLLPDLINLLKQASSPWYKVFKQAYKAAAENEFGKKIDLNSERSEIFVRTPAAEYDYVKENNDVQPTKYIISTEELEHYFSTNGTLSQHIDNYEYRLPQLEMAKAVTDILNEGGYLLAEAGTGTGKSIAYLLPSAIWTVKNKQKAVVSTHTINLQEQLYKKDIPLLQSMGLDFKAVLLKGRNHYICLQKWYSVRDSYMNLNTVQNLTEREAAFYARIAIWLSSTLTGDCSELNIITQEYDLWRRICSASETCLGDKCKFAKDKCFVNRIKRVADKADIIVVNHSLVFADIKAENKVLPNYDLLIIDEAHNLEDAAALNLGVRIARFDAVKWLNNLNNILLRISKQQPTFEQEDNAQKIKKIKVLSRKASDNIDVLFEAVLELMNKNLQNSDKSFTSFRITSDSRLELQSTATKAVNSINELCELLNQLISEAQLKENMIKELILIFKKGLSTAKGIAYTFYNNEAIVCWVEKKNMSSELEDVSLYAVPVEVDKMLYDYLYLQKEKMIFTSATLTIDSKFDYFMDRVGLGLVEPQRLKKIKLDSPFEYDKQSLLFVVNDLELPESDSEYREGVCDLLKDLVMQTNGRTLVLFTSHKMLKEVYYALKPEVESKGILLLGHAIDGGRNRLVEEFINIDKSVLFGASSFWEGVDIPGVSLSCVVLVKLPFWSPKIPIVEARHEALKKQGKNPFQHFTLPEAIIKFKQGVGRLIRKDSDYGVVIVLDKRIIEKEYGINFLRSLPIKNHMKGDKIKMLDTVKRWFA